MKEVWRDIPNFNNIYQVSNLGNVKALKRKIKHNDIIITIKGKDKKAYTTKDGYKRVELSKNGISRKYLVHRLVAEAFILNPRNKPQVNHIDGNKQNNRVDNLEWCNNSENQLHAYKNNLNKTTDLQKQWCRKLGEKYGGLRKKSICQYSLEGQFIAKWESAKEASEILKVSTSSISQCLRKRNKSAGGYIWSYNDQEI